MQNALGHGHRIYEPVIFYFLFHAVNGKGERRRSGCFKYCFSHTDLRCHAHNKTLERQDEPIIDLNIRGCVSVEELLLWHSWRHVYVTGWGLKLWWWLWESLDNNEMKKLVEVYMYRWCIPLFLHSHSFISLFLLILV